MEIVKKNMDSIKRSFLLITLAINVIACSGNNHSTINLSTETHTDSIRTIIQQMFFRYQFFEEEESLLDSIVMIIDDNIDSDKIFLSMQKAAVMSIKKDYEAGKNALLAIDDTLIAPVFKHLCIRHFDAMIAASNGQEEDKKVIVQQIVDSLRTIVPQTYIDSVIATGPKNIFHCELGTYIVMYYFYMGQQEGFDSLHIMVREKYGDSEDLHLTISAIENMDFMVFAGM